MKFREYIKKMIYGKRYNSDSYITYLRKLGVKIGEDCTIYVPSKTLIDEQYPWMITIGNHVRITEGVKILTHDYSWSVLKNIGGVF
jgi:acetyltransferase-like isoleucine patch superfamily enzyme